MMWFRFLGVAIVKWISVFFLITVFTAYLAPSFLRGYWLALPIWIVVAAVAYGFAYWALHPRFPGKKEVIGLTAIWMVVTISLEVFYELLTIGSPVFVLYSPDLYVQYLLEIVAILVAARTVRRHKIQTAAGEGVVA